MGASIICHLQCVFQSQVQVSVSLGLAWAHSATPGHKRDYSQLTRASIGISEKGIVEDCGEAGRGQ